MQLVYFSSSEPAPKNAQTPFYALSNTTGNLAFYSPLPSERGRGRGCIGCVLGFFFPILHSQTHRGIPLIVPPLPSERVGERLYEIPLQIIRHYCSQINPLSLKTAFVTYRESVSYKQDGKRCPFALQNMPFYTSKDALLHCKRASFTTQKGVYGKIEGKEIDKNNPQNTASPSPSRGRGCAWRDMECYVLGR